MGSKMAARSAARRRFPHSNAARFKRRIRPATADSTAKQWEMLIGEMAEEKSKQVGMPRREFMRSSMGLATAFLASNMIYGENWEVDAEETLNPDVTEEKFPKGEYFIIDVQTHFTDGVALGFRSAEFVRNMGFELKDKPRCL